jgi:hypothetical protein
MARQMNRELFYFSSYLPSATTPIYQAQATCLLLVTCEHALTSVCISCGQFIILCRRSFLCVILLLFCIILKGGMMKQHASLCSCIEKMNAWGTGMSNISANNNLETFVITRFARSLSIVSVRHEIDDWNWVKHVRFQVFTAASMKFRFVFWDVLPCKIIVDRRFRGRCCLHHQGETHRPDDGGLPRVCDRPRSVSPSPKFTNRFHSVGASVN